MVEKKPRVISDIESDSRQMEALLNFVDFIVATDYSRVLQVYACHLRASLKDPNGLSRLTVPEVATILGIPEISIKRAHKRLSDDGWLKRDQASERSTLTALHVMTGGADMSLLCVSPSQDPELERLPSNHPPKMNSRNTCIAELYSALAESSEELSNTHNVNSTDPFHLLSPSENSSNNSVTPVSSTSHMVLTDTQVSSIQKMVKEVAGNTGVTYNEQYMDQLASEVIWSIIHGVYRNRPLREGLRICLATIRNGKWKQPMAYSQSEGNALMRTR